MFKKSLAIALVTAMFTGMTYIPVNASSTDENGTLQSLITAQISSSWVITVPDSITLDADKTAEYEVSISGDVAEHTSISVVPESTVILNNGYGKSVSAIISQDKQQWLGTEIDESGAATTGSVLVAEEMAAGTWAGSLNFNVNCTENLGDLLAKRDMMRSLDIYTMGDSILDGYMGYDYGYYGAAEALDNLYGVNSYKNYAVSGATLTEATDTFPNVVQQFMAFYSRITNTRTGYNERSVVIFDGGGNDILLSQREPDTYNITIKNWSSDEENGHYDIASTLTYLMYLMESAEGLSGVNAPIIYVVPCFQGLDAEMTKLNEIIVSLQRTRPDLLLIDCRDFIEESDMGDDKHLNSSGQTKLAHAIVDALYDYYN